MIEEIEIKGLSDYQKQLAAAANEYAATAEKHLRKAGNALKKMAKEKSPDSGTKHRHKIKESWTGEVDGTSGQDLEYKLRNKAPHYHLVERGHVQTTPSGRVTGFVPGRHFFEAACKDFESSGVADKEVEAFLNEVGKKIDS